MTANPLTIAMIGAGAMGGSFGAALARAGNRVTLIESDPVAVAVIARDGLVAEGALGRIEVRVPVSAEVDAPGTADIAVVLVTTRDTAQAAQTAARALKPGAPVITLQNGIGNIEALQAVLGATRVLAGSTKCSGARAGPGRPILTHLKETVIGELDGRTTPRAADFARAMSDAGLPTTVHANILGVIWEKLAWNTAMNAVSATTGLRLAEAARIPELDALRERLLDEFLAVVAAKGIALSNPDPRAAIRSHAWSEYSQPSMLQHVEACRLTEIDAINGAVVREARALGIAVPYNEAVVALLKGREQAMRQSREPAKDYASLEAEAKKAYAPH